MALSRDELVWMASIKVLIVGNFTVPQLLEPQLLAQPRNLKVRPAHEIRRKYLQVSRMGRRDLSYISFEAEAGQQRQHGQDVRCRLL
jgi:hypothetical protein